MKRRWNPILLLAAFAATVFAASASGNSSQPGSRLEPISVTEGISISDVIGHLDTRHGFDCDLNRGPAECLGADDGSGLGVSHIGGGIFQVSRGGDCWVKFRSYGQRGAAGPQGAEMATHLEFECPTAVPPPGGNRALVPVDRVIFVEGSF